MVSQVPATSKPRLYRSGLRELRPMVRTPGVHLSQCISHICIERGYFEQSELDYTRLEIGCAWEDAEIQRYHESNPGRYVTPGEGEVDGIIGTPDLLDLGKRRSAVYCRQCGRIESGLWCGHPKRWREVRSQRPAWSKVRVEDIKFTWLSAKHDPESKVFWKYWAQLAGYCRLFGLTRATLNITHCNGLYSSNGFKPVHNVWRRNFTQLEIEQNWKTLTSVAPHIQPEAPCLLRQGRYSKVEAA